MSDPLLKLIAGLSPEKRAMLADLLRPQPDPIAIIGMSCRLPGGANSPAAFWRLLAGGVDAIGEVPPDRWDVDAYYHPDSTKAGRMNSRWGGFIADVDQFDAAYFGITPREAMWMDPQQRLLLEVSVEALEAAGQTADRLRTSQGGVFIGISSNDYARHQFADQLRIDAYASTGGAHSLAANRLSYLLDLRGPSVALDTACSSSLVAVHLACQSLRSKECHLAIAGGVNLMLSPEVTISFSRFGMLSPDGRCKTFDAGADGFVRGEGCGIVVLKRLPDALAGNDPILALIRGSAVNQDGRSAGLTAPNGQAQQAVIRQALAQAGLAADQLTYLEAHGTGTSLGDPIEVEAFAALVGKPKRASQWCALGSVKTNIGHLEAAAGVAGLIKVVVSLQHEAIPPTLHVRTLNPHISIGGTPLAIAAEGRPWPAGNEPRYAGVSSFGFGGTNAHAVLEEAPRLSPAPYAATTPETPPAAAAGRPRAGADVDRPHLLPLSARSAASLRATVDEWKEWLAGPNVPALEDVCYTAAIRRNHHPYRVSVVGRSCVELSHRLNAVVVPEVGAVGSQQKVVFAFSGQGTQWAGVGRELLSSERTFRDAIAECDAATRTLLNWSIAERLASAEIVEDTDRAQPLLCALQIGLAAVWRSWGIEPAAVVGHSLGEIAAAHVAGVLDIGQAMRLAVLRGRLMQRLHGHGAMAAVELSEIEAAGALAAFAGRVSIGAVNGPTSTVLSGETAAVQSLATALQAQGVRTKVLGVAYAFHNPALQPLQEELQRALADLAPSSASIPLLSTLTGRWADGTDLDAGYWGRQLVEPVRFLPAIEALIGAGRDVFVELGAHPVLAPDITQSLKRLGSNGWVLPSLRRQRGDRETMLESLGRLYELSGAVTWPAVAPAGGRCVPLPTYRWDHRRFWLDDPVRPSLTPLHGRAECHPLLGYELPPVARTAGVRIWQGTLDREEHGYLWEHRVQAIPLLAAAAYIEMGLATIADADPLVVTNVTFLNALVLPANGSRVDLQVSVAAAASGGSTFEIHSRPQVGGTEEARWTLHATGTIGGTSNAASVQENAAIDEIRSRCTDAYSGESFYQTIRDGGLEYGPAFQAVEQLWRRDGEALGRLRLAPDAAGDAGRYRIHPALLDAAFQLFAATPAVRGGEVEDGSVYVPVGIDFLSLHRACATAGWSHATLRPSNDSTRQTLTGDVSVYDDDHRMVAEIRGLRVRRVDPAALEAATERPEDWLYEMRWLPQTRIEQPASGPSPEYLRGPEAVAGMLAPHLPELRAQHGLAVYEELSPRLDALSTAYVWRAFAQLGWRLEKSDRVTFDDLVARLGVAAPHHRLLRRLLAMLVEDGVLRDLHGDWEVEDASAAPDPEDLRLALLARFPEARAELTLLGRCGQSLAAVLQGNADPRQLIFPDGSLTLAEQVYQDSPVSQAFNTLVQQAVSAAIAGLPPGRTVRMLEIGAGTGGTTASVLAAVPPAQTDYVFTDVSSLFTTRAAQKFRSYPFVRYRTLDIEHDPRAQGFAPHLFDIVLAANVLHATADLRQTVRHAKELLAPGGVLVLLEGTGPERYVDLTFGLMEGWWKFNDFALRPSHPLLSRAGWKALLRDEGFTEAVALPDGTTHADSRQAVLIARVPREAPSLATDLPAPDAGGSWLILADAEGTGAALATLLEARGGRCVVVPASAADGLDAARPETFRTFLARACAGQAPCRGIVNLWALDAPSELLDTEQRLCGSVLYLLQHVVRAAWRPSPRLWLVTHNSQVASARDEIVNAVQAPLWGMGRVIALEHPELWGGMVDLDGSRSRAEAAALLLQEILQPGDEDHVAFRDGQRFVARLLRAAPSPVATAARFDPRGTYVITGGSGGLGLLVAKWMVERGARHLALVGRREPAADVRNAVTELERQGARVAMLRADVARSVDVADVLATIDRDMPTLRGVIHAAGTLADGILLQQDWTRFSTVMHAKILGAWNLHEQTKRRDLECFVLFSSIAALLGSPGQANHAAANAYMDALAHHRRTQGLAGLSINWGAWSGIGAAAGRHGEHAVLRGMGMLTPDQGIEALERVWSHPRPQVGAARVQWEALLRQLGSRRQPPLISELARETRAQGGATPADSSRLRAQLRHAAPADRLGLLNGHISEQVMRVMRLDPTQRPNPRQGLFELGMDSLMALELQNALQASLGYQLPATTAFDYPSIGALAEYLDRQLFPADAATVVDDEPPAISEELEEVLAEIDQLSDEDAKAALRGHQ